MFVLDGLRKIRKQRLYVPRFHLGHLGFIPRLKVDFRYGPLDISEGHELTLTPFQGNREDLFLIKCVFIDRPGVVQNALSAFAALNLNILSLESATIEGDRKHVLFCILSWNRSPHRSLSMIDEGTKHKYINYLPLLPVLQKRYLLLLQMLILFCINDLDHEETSEKSWLPKVHMRLFDAFSSQQGNWAPIEVEVERPSESDDRGKIAGVFFDLSPAIGHHGRHSEAEALVFSETETKTLRLIFPGSRTKRFLHIGFTHRNNPGAVLSIASLLRHLGFNIVTSLLRKHDSDHNIWETMVEYVEGRGTSLEIPRGIDGVHWFLNHCLERLKKSNGTTNELIEDMLAYDVRACRPSYPRSIIDRDTDFASISMLDALESVYQSPPTDALGRKIKPDEFTNRLEVLSTEAKRHQPYKSPLASLIYSDLRRKFKFLKHSGTVFLSLPSHCKGHHDIVKVHLERELKLEVKAYINQNSGDICTTALEMIRDADYFFAVWHPDPDRPREVSPWMPFEYGVARSLGKPKAMIVHCDLPTEVKRRIDPATSLVEYEDLTFRERLEEVLQHCKASWLAGSGSDAYIDTQE